MSRASNVLAKRFGTAENKAFFTVLRQIVPEGVGRCSAPQVDNDLFRKFVPREKLAKQLPGNYHFWPKLLLLSLIPKMGIFSALLGVIL